MGDKINMGGECSNLALLSNPCELGRCVESATIKSRSSGSSSMQFFLKLQPRSHFNGEPVSQVFAKVFINPSTFDEKKYNQFKQSQKFQQNVQDFSKIQLSLNALKFEMSIYGGIIEPIVTQRVCPFFTTVYSVGYNCSFQDLKHLLRATTAVQIQMLETALASTLITIKVHLKQGMQFSSDVKYCVILSKQSGDQTLRRILKENYRRPLTPEIKKNWFKLLFQVAVGVYVLQLAGVAHNDLHGNNILCPLSEKAQAMCIAIGMNPTTYYQYSTHYIPNIYDFDRASFVNHPSPYKDTLEAKGTSYTSTVRESQDFLRLVVHLFYDFFKGHKKKKPEYKATAIKFYLMPLLRILARNEEVAAQIRSVASNSPFLIYNNNSLPAELFAQLTPMREVIHELAKLAEIQVSTSRPEPQPEEQLYFVDPSFFKDSQVQTAAVQDAVLPVFSKDKGVKGDVPPSKMRNVEAELTMQLYDLEQMAFRQEQGK